MAGSTKGYGYGSLDKNRPGAPTWRETVLDVPSLPATGNKEGDTRLVLAPSEIWRWDEGTSSWIICSGAVPAPATTVQSETSYGQSPAVGTALTYAREDHTHGTPDSVPQLLSLLGIDVDKDWQSKNITNLGYIQLSDDVRITSDNKQLEIGALTGGDIQLTHDGSDSYYKSVTGKMIFINNAITQTDSTGKTQFISQYIPSSGAGGSCIANRFYGLIDLRSISPGTSSNVGNRFASEFQSQDTVPGFISTIFVGTEFTNIIQGNSTAAPRMQTFELTGVKYKVDFTGTFIGIGMNAYPMVIDIDFTATCAMSHQIAGLNITTTYNKNNMVNQLYGIYSTLEIQGNANLLGNMDALVGTVTCTAGSTVGTQADCVRAYLKSGYAAAWNGVLAAGKKMVLVFADASGWSMAARETFGFYCNLPSNVNNKAFFAQFADSVFGGNVSIGKTTTPTVALDVVGNGIISGTLHVGTQQTYNITNVVTDRAYDASATTLDEIANVLGTLIADLRAIGLVL